MYVALRVSSSANNLIPRKLPLLRSQPLDLLIDLFALTRPLCLGSTSLASRSKVGAGRWMNRLGDFGPGG